MDEREFSRLLRSSPRPVSNDDFLAAAFDGMDRSQHTIVASVAGDPTRPDLDRKVWGGRPWRVGDSTRQKGVRDDQNNYLTISSFRPDENGRRRRIKACFERLHCVMVDDIGPKVDPGKITVPFTAAVETSPGNVQGWYFLRPTPASKDLATSTAFIEALVEHGLQQAADPGMKGVTRFGRLPVGRNLKSAYGEGGYASRLLLWRPSRTYTLEELAREYGLSPLRAGRPTRRAVLTPAEVKRFGRQFVRLLAFLERTGRIKSYDSHAGRYEISCPWLHEHTAQADNGTALFVPSANNDMKGGFACHHGHCEKRTLWDLKAIANADTMMQLAAVTRRAGTLKVSA